MDLQGQIFERGVLPEVQKNPHKFLDFLVEKVEWYKKNYSYMEFGVAGLSVILPANYNKNTGYVEYIQSMQEWNGFNISAALKERIPDVLSFVMPACQAAALGEIHFGASNPLRYMACILGVLGITMSIYSQGSFFSGKDGFAGRLGHTIVEKNGRQCVCGNKGCLEMYSALRPILDKMGLYKERGYENIRMLMELKKKNDPQLLEVLKEASEYMAITIVNIANMYNVEEVCISGYLGTLLEGDMLNKIRKDVEGMLKEHYKKGFKVYCSKLGSFACVYGGIALIRDELVEVITSRAKNNTAEN